jgi:hypothetical protein
VLYLVLNTVFVLVAVFTVPGFPITDITYIIALIFAPIFVTPSEAWIGGVVGLINTVDLMTDLMAFLGLIIPPLVTIIVVAFIADNPKVSFGAWLGTALVSCVVYSILLGLGQGMSSYLAIEWFAQTALYGELGTILAIFFAGIINSFFYGAVAFILAREGL